MITIFELIIEERNWLINNKSEIIKNSLEENDEDFKNDMIEHEEKISQQEKDEEEEWKIRLDRIDENNS